MFYWSRSLRGHMIFGKNLSITQQTVDNALALVSLAFLVDLHLDWTADNKDCSLPKELLLNKSRSPCSY